MRGGTGIQPPHLPMELIKEYWAQLSAVGAAILGAAKLLRKRARRHKAWQDTITASILAILHDKLLFECLHYLKAEQITADEMDNLSLLYKQYNALGGNGTIAKLMERVGMYVKIIECDCERGYDT